MTISITDAILHNVTYAHPHPPPTHITPTHYSLYTHPHTHTLTPTHYTHTHSPSSQSSLSMAVKSALPTPTMMMDMGSREARMMALMVSGMSDITPSVSISRMKYCYKGECLANSFFLIAVYIIHCTCSSEYTQYICHVNLKSIWKKNKHVYRYQLLTV